MDKDDKNNNNSGEKIANAMNLGLLLGLGLIMIVNPGENDAEKAAEKYLESLESNHDLNKKVDALIEGFTMASGSCRLGDDFEEYLGISLEPSKKQRLNDIAVELDNVKCQLDHTSKSPLTFETQLSDASLEEANEIITANIIDDNDLNHDFSLSLEYGKDYGWVVSKDYYQIFDEALNEYVSSYELLNSRFTDLSDNAKEYENIINGVLKSSLCDIVLDENSTNVKIIIPSEVKELVKKR